MACRDITENHARCDNSNSQFNSLSRNEIEDLRDAFKLFDTEKRGKMSAQELRDTMISLIEDDASNLSLSKRTEVDRILRSLRALPDSKFLTLDDFIKLLTAPDANDTRDEMRKVFDLFDADGKGFITVQDLQKTAADLGENMSEEELAEMIHRAAPSGTYDTNYLLSLLLINKITSSASSFTCFVLVIRAKLSGRVNPEDFARIMTKNLFS